MGMPAIRSFFLPVVLFFAAVVGMVAADSGYAAEPIRTWAIITRPLTDTALVGLVYRSSVWVTPLDKRNAIEKLTISNPTKKGSRPRIDMRGRVTWMPNEADFSSTKQLRIVAKMKTGEEVVLYSPVLVRKFRIVFETSLKTKESSYSDQAWRYLVRVKPKSENKAIKGTLSVVEEYSADGSFMSRYAILNEENAFLEVIEAPISPLSEDR